MLANYTSRERCRNMRPCERFLQERGGCLSEIGFIPDPGRPEQTCETIVFYHYTRHDRIDTILAPSSGLHARRPVDCPNLPVEFHNMYMVEGFLEPLPRWLKSSPYFGDIGMKETRKHVGDMLLRIELSKKDFANVYVVDYAHPLDCQFGTRECAGLALGYQNPAESYQGYVNSYISAQEYRGGHVAPVVHVLRKGQGIAVSEQHICVSSVQPLQGNQEIG